MLPATKTHIINNKYMLRIFTQQGRIPNKMDILYNMLMCKML